MNFRIPRREPATLAAVLLVTLGVYVPALSSSFHFDDYAIFADPYVTSPDGWWRVFRPSQTRPLTYFTFWVNYRLGGADPRGYHAMSLGLHLAAAALAWAVFRRLLDSSGALAATAVFALHPLQSEAVVYVFARATLLATLLCLEAWRNWLDSRRWRAAAWFALASLAKEECVAFPLFVALVEAVRGRWRREAWTAWVTMLALSVAAGLRLLYVAAGTAGSGLGPGAGGISRTTYLLSQPRVICDYLRLFLFPFGQNFDHDVRPYAGLDAAAVLATLTLAALVALVAWRRERGVWLLGALLLLSPSSSVVPLADLMFEHRMYLPLLSLACGAGALAHPRIVLALALAAAPATWTRVRVWSSEQTLWSDAVAKSPGKVRPKLQLARALAGRDPQHAETLLLEARRLEPSNPETFTQLGTLLLDRSDPARALEEFDQAVRLKPGGADGHSNRGVALYLLGRFADADLAFARALELDPCHPNARQNLTVLDKARGRPLDGRATPSGCPPLPNAGAPQRR